MRTVKFNDVFSYPEFLVGNTETAKIKRARLIAAACKYHASSANHDSRASHRMPTLPVAGSEDEDNADEDGDDADVSQAAADHMV